MHLKTKSFQATNQPAYETVSPARPCPCFLLPAFLLFFAVENSFSWHRYHQRNQRPFFLTATEGYVASDHYIGYTQDGGKTFQKKFITFSNVSFNGYGVNLTFGFSPAGITALTKHRLLVYGDYGLEPSILYSSDAGATWKLVYHKNMVQNASNIYNAVREKKFYNSTNGFAIQNDEIMKTTDGGRTWAISLLTANVNFQNLLFSDATTGYAVSALHIYKMNTSWGFWTVLSNAPQGAYKVSFATATTGCIYCNGYSGDAYYKTVNGGNSWTRAGRPTYLCRRQRTWNLSTKPPGLQPPLVTRFTKLPTPANRGSWAKAAMILPTSITVSRA